MSLSNVIAFKLVFYLTVPLLKAAAGLVVLYENHPYLRFPIWLVWLPVRGLGLLGVKICKALS